MDLDSLSSGGTLDRDLINKACERIDARISDFDQTWMKQYLYLQATMNEIRNGDMKLYKRNARSLIKGIERQNAFYPIDNLDGDRKFVMTQLVYEWNKIRQMKENAISDPAAIARFERDTEERHWMDGYRKIQAIHQTYGKILYSSEDQELDVWISEQRQLRREKTLRKDREQLLEELGIVWIKEEDDDDTETWGKIRYYNNADFECMTEAHVLALECEETLFGNLVFFTFDESAELGGAEALGFLPHSDDGDKEYVLETEDARFLDGTESPANRKENANSSETISRSNAAENELVRAVPFRENTIVPETPQTAPPKKQRKGTPYRRSIYSQKGK